MAACFPDAAVLPLDFIKLNRFLFEENLRFASLEHVWGPAGPTCFRTRRETAAEQAPGRCDGYGGWYAGVSRLPTSLEGKWGREAKLKPIWICITGSWELFPTSLSPRLPVSPHGLSPHPSFPAARSNPSLLQLSSRFSKGICHWLRKCWENSLHIWSSIRQLHHSISVS